jgi:flagellar capping protein FliD
MLNTVSDPKSSVPNYGASLTNNAMVSTVRSQIRNLLFSPDAKVKSGDMSSFMDLGFSHDKTGVLSFAPDTASSGSKIDNLLATRLDDVVTFLTQNKSGIQTFSPVNNGIAGEAYKALDKMMLPTGDLSVRSANLNSRIADYNKDLLKLQERMAKLLTSYTKQFSVMDAIVGQGKTTRDGLTNMMTAYTNSNK